MGTVVGTLVAFSLLPLRSLGSDSWKIAAALMSRHIGGAVNYVAVTEALQASPSVVASGLAADNLICALYFTALFALAAGIPADAGDLTGRVCNHKGCYPSFVVYLRGMCVKLGVFNHAVLLFSSYRIPSIIIV